MRLPRPRFTVRRLMVLVALLGALLGVGIEGNRRMTRFSRRAFYHRVNAMGPGVDLGPAFERKRAWHEQMERKYDYAAGHPWLPVAADPPPPE